MFELIESSEINIWWNNPDFSTMKNTNLTRAAFVIMFSKSVKPLLIRFSVCQFVMIFRHGRHKPSLSLSELEEANWRNSWCASGASPGALPGATPKDAERRRHTQVTVMSTKCVRHRIFLCFSSIFYARAFPLFAESASHFVCILQVKIFVIFSFFLRRYHGNSDQVGGFVASRPLYLGNRYFEVRLDHSHCVPTSLSVNFSSSTWCWV